MNWNALHVDWNHLRAFLATAEEGSLSAAARALGQTQPTLGRQVAALEHSLGVTLFERLGRRLALTEAGRALLAHVRAMGHAAEHVALTAAGQSDAVAGKVRISASDAVCAYQLPNILLGLRAAAPSIELQIVADNQISDILRREADIAIRHVAPNEPELIARRLPNGYGRFYAATSWLAKNRPPRKIADLAEAALVGADRAEVMQQQLAKRGVDVAPLFTPIWSRNGTAMWELVKAGHGLGLMSDAIAAETPGVQAIDIDGIDGIEIPTWLITHRELRTARRIRVVFDYLATTFTAKPHAAPAT
ncbi:MAG: LysR family transcriptional regulator [Pseudomonadota bacterium]